MPWYVIVFLCVIGVIGIVIYLLIGLCSASMAKYAWDLRKELYGDRVKIFWNYWAWPVTILVTSGRALLKKCDIV